MSKKSSKSGRSQNKSSAFGRWVTESEKLSVPELRRYLERVGAVRRSAMVAQAKQVLKDRSLVAREDVRIAAVKTLVADLGRNLEFVRSLLKVCASHDSYEVQFTLFCWLDREDLPPDQRLKNQVLSVVVEYLLGVERETAHAAWMAGDLLGDHWRTQAAHNALQRIALQASHPAGRKGAIHGLEESCRWVSPSRRVGVVRLLTRISHSDPRSSVRDYANSVLSRLTS